MQGKKEDAWARAHMACMPSSLLKHPYQA